MKIKTNDKIKVLSGKDRGKVAKVIQVFVKEDRVVVEGVNQIKKHLRARSQNEKGQVIELAAPLHVSNVSLMCPKCDKPTRVAYNLEGNKKMRICRKCKGTID